jgi:hypothetical protein
VSSDPAGMTTILPLLNRRGTGPPQSLQNHLPNLLAMGRSYRVMLSSPVNHLIWSGLMPIFVAWPVPELLRQREQWQ